MQASEAERINLYVPKSLSEWLQKQAEEDHRSLNNYITIVLENHKKEK